MNSLPSLRDFVASRSRTLDASLPEKITQGNYANRGYSVPYKEERYTTAYVG